MEHEWGYRWLECAPNHEDGNTDDSNDGRLPGRPTIDFCPDGFARSTDPLKARSGGSAPLSRGVSIELAKSCPGIARFRAIKTLYVWIKKTGGDGNENGGMAVGRATDPHPGRPDGNRLPLKPDNTAGLPPDVRGSLGVINNRV